VKVRAAFLKWWYPLALGGFVAGVFGWNVYRAATLGITHDEAVTWEWFVARGPGRIFSAREFDANNHVLYSLLAWAAVRLLGLSEFFLRLPSVLGGLGLLLATTRLFRLLSGSRALTLAGLAAVALNPLAMDFQVAARGYGLGLALSVWAWYLLGRTLVTRTESREESRALVTAGLAQGLAVGANLVYAFPNLALGLAYLPVRIVSSGADRRATSMRLALRYVLPGTAVALVLTIPLVGHLGSDRFYYGTATLAEAAQSLVQPSVYALSHRDPWGLPPELDPDGPGLGSYALMAGVVGLLVPLPAALYRLSRNGAASRDKRTVLYAFVAGGLVALLGLLAAAHWAVGVPFPKDRTGLYFIPLTVGCLILTVRHRRAWAAGTTITLAGLAGVFAWQTQAEYLYLWRFDAGTVRVYRLLAARAVEQPGLRVGHDWVFEPGLNFCRALDAVPPFPPFGRENPNGDCDVFYLEAQTAREWMSAGRLRVVYEDPVSGSVVGVPVASRPP
jgi:hypothetical protein